MVVTAQTMVEGVVVLWLKGGGCCGGVGDGGCGGGGGGDGGGEGVGKGFENGLSIYTRLSSLVSSSSSSCGVDQHHVCRHCNKFFLHVIRRKMAEKKVKMLKSFGTNGEKQIYMKKNKNSRGTSKHKVNGSLTFLVFFA